MGLFYAVLFVIGAACGSFLNVMISRMIKGENWVSERSRCERCGKKLLWYDMVPVLSYIVLGGKCRFCRKPIALQHPIVEILVGALFLWWGVVGVAFFRIVQSPLTYFQPAYWLILGMTLLAILVADWYYGLIPDFFVWIVVLFSTIYRLVLVQTGVMQGMDFSRSVYAAIGGWAFYYVLHAGSKGRGMGLGDVKLAFAMGLVLGWPRTLVAHFLAFTTGAAFGILMLILGKKKLGQTVPFGPFMVGATYAALLWGNQLWNMFWG